MLRQRLSRSFAVCLVAAAATAPAAAAMPSHESPDGYDRNHPYQNLSSPDARDAAAGTGSSLPAEVVTVKEAPRASTPVHWDDIGVGAAGAFAITLAGLGAATVLVRRRGPVSP